LIDPEIVNSVLLTDSPRALRRILESVQRQYEAYAWAMRSTMDFPDAVIEMAYDRPDDEVAVITVDRQRPVPLKTDLDRLGAGEDLEQFEVAVARLEKGGKL
jgi:hypothetical protein